MPRGPQGHASAEPPPGPELAAPGPHDEPAGEDDPATHRPTQSLGPGRGQRTRTELKGRGSQSFELFEISEKSLLSGIIEYDDSKLTFLITLFMF